MPPEQLPERHQGQGLPTDESLIQENQAISPDSRARELERELSEQHQRHQFAIRNAIHWIYLGFLALLGSVVFTAVIIRSIHLLTPQAWHWLTSEQTQSIDKVFFSGVAGALIAREVRKIFGFTDSPQQ